MKDFLEKQDKELLTHAILTAKLRWHFQGRTYSVIASKILLDFYSTLPSTLNSN